MTRRCNWQTRVLPLLALVASQLFSSSWAWSNAAFSASHIIISPVKSKQHNPQLPSRSRVYNRLQNYHRQLWMSNDDNDTSSNDAPSIVDDDEIPQKLTLEKAISLLSTFWSMAYPYYRESQAGRRLFLGMILLTLMNSGVSVAFSYISKDFWNALSGKDVTEFYSMMLKFGGALVIGAPVAVLYR